MTELQAAILRALKEAGPLSDQMLLTLLEGRASDSSIRTRRKELQRLGLVRDSGERGTTRSGRSCVLWQASPEIKSLFRNHDD